MMAATVYPRPESIPACAARLAELGYWPLPVPAGHKGPTIEGWPTLRLTPAECLVHFKPGMLIGISHENTCVLDIDVTDPILSDRICAEARLRFPGALERIGQAPKSSLWLRMEAPGFTVANTRRGRVTTEDGQTYTAQVEVRSKTRQAIAYGLHPDTGKPYRWVGAELWATPLAELQLAEESAITAFRDWCAEQIYIWADNKDELRPPAPAPLPPSNVINLDFGRSADRPPEAEFLGALQHVTSSTGYDEWLSNLMAIHDYYGGSPSGLAVAQQWSAPYPDYSAREVDAKWRSFEAGKGVSYKTIFAAAKAAGADLAALAREHRPALPQITLTAVSLPAVAAGEAQEAPAAPAGKVEWYDDLQPALGNTYIVKGVLDAGAMSVLYGQSNSGKTFFAMDLAFHIAAGCPWRGRRVTACPVLYLAAEGGRGVTNRIVALRRETGVCDVPLALKRAGMDLLHSGADLQEIVNLAAEVQARNTNAPLLIVIDTLSRVMAGGDENSAADMTALIRNIDAIREATKAHVMLIHHTGKDTAKGARGHSSLRAATDTEIEVANEEGNRLAMVTKQRDNQGGETFAFTLKTITLGTDQDGDEVTTCVVVPADAEEVETAIKRKKGLGGNQKIIADTFDQMLAEGMGTPNPGGVGFPEPGRYMTVDIDQLRRLSQDKMAGSDPGRLFRQAWTALTDARGLFCAADKRVWRTDRRKR